MDELTEFRLPLGTIGRQLTDKDYIHLYHISRNFADLMLNNTDDEEILVRPYNGTSADIAVILTWYGDNNLRKQKTFFFIIENFLY
jgi:hypothetical protein